MLISYIPRQLLTLPIMKFSYRDNIRLHRIQEQTNGPKDFAVLSGKIKREGVRGERKIILYRYNTILMTERRKTENKAIISIVI